MRPTHLQTILCCSAGRELPPICNDVRHKQRFSIDTLPPEVKAPFPSDPIIPLRTKTTKEFQWVSLVWTNDQQKSTKWLGHKEFEFTSKFGFTLKAQSVHTRQRCLSIVLNVFSCYWSDFRIRSMEIQCLYCVSAPQWCFKFWLDVCDSRDDMERAVLLCDWREVREFYLTTFDSFIEINAAFKVEYVHSYLTSSEVRKQNLITLGFFFWFCSERRMDRSTP